MKSKKILKISLSTEEIVDVFQEIARVYGPDGIKKLLKKLRKRKGYSQKKK